MVQHARDLGLGTFLIAFSLLVLNLSADLPRAPAFFPRVISLVMLGLGLVQWGAVAVKARRRTGVARAGKSGGRTTSELRGVGRILGLMLVYALLLPVLGFLVATPPMMVAMTWLLGYRNWPVALLSAGTTTLFVYLFFQVLMQVSLPPVPFLNL